MSKEAIVIFKHNNLQMHLKNVKVLFSHTPKLYRFEEYRLTLNRGLEIDVPCIKELLGRLEIKLMTGD